MSQPPPLPPGSGAAGSGAASCWNCRQPVPAGSARCLWCGVAQDRGATPIAPPPVAPAGSIGLPPAAPPGPAAGYVPAGIPAALGPGFDGRPATVGLRILAFTLDGLAIAVVATIVAVATRSAVYTALAVFESFAGLWVLEARTGLTVGNLLLRQRTSRVDKPYSPGAGRTLLRGVIVGLGGLVAGVGAWIVVLSSAWDSSGRGRSWADRVAGTVVVAVPHRPRVPAAGAVTLAAGPGIPTTAPPPAAGRPDSVLAAPQVVSTLQQVVVDDNSLSGSRTGATPASPDDAPRPPVVAVQPRTPPAPAEPPAAAESEGTLLLVFDTGQREQIPVPCAINLGRNPVATEAGDRLIVVQDPESTVSKTHLRLEHSRGRTWVTDGGSTNGSDIVDDEGEATRLVAGVRTPLDEGSRVRIGTRAFTVSVLLGEAR